VCKQVGVGSHHDPGMTRKLAWCGLGSIAAVAAGIACYFLTRAPGLEAQAEALVRAAVGGDHRTVYGFSHEYEKAKCGLTEANIEALWRYTIRPRLSGFKLAPHHAAQLLNNGNTVYLAIVGRNDKRFEMEFAVSVNSTEDGPRALVLGFLVQSWIAEFVIKRGMKLSRRTGLQARIEGVRKDKAVLDRLGIKGLVGGHPEDEVVPWEELSAKCSEALLAMDGLQTDRPK
jgi:hypothetical protein